MISSRSARAAFAVLLMVGLLAPVAASQNSSTAYIGDDLDGLTAALQNDPQNIGLRLRIVRKMLSVVKETTDITVSRRLLTRVQDQLAKIRELGPQFTYIYRVLATQAYRRGEHEKFLEIIADYEKFATPDYAMRTMYVKNLLRMATRTKNPEPARKKEAAEYVGNWFDSGAAPVFGDTLGACAAWLRDVEFRRELISIFKQRYDKNPRNLNLVISYAACLSALGRNETAWNLIHRAERDGLCDDLTGGRHAVAHLIQWQTPENPEPDTYDGYDIDTLKSFAEKFPKNASFHHRMALILKRKGVAAEGVANVLKRRADMMREDGKVPQDRIAKFDERAVEGLKRAEGFYLEALPHAVKTLELNPEIEALSLLLADLYSKVGQDEKAIKHLADSIAKVPFFSQLRDKLAQVHASRKEWKEAAVQLAEVCQVVSCRAADWDQEATESLLPVPEDARELLIVAMVKDPQARKALIAEFNRVAKEKPGNPNVKTFLAMIQYYAGNRAEASRWMLDAEKNGMCGEDGFEHSLSTIIYSRERW